MLSPCSEHLPLACLQTPTVVDCTSLHERRGCSGASTLEPAWIDELSVVCSGSILPFTVSAPPADASGDISPRSFRSLLVDLEAKHGSNEGDLANDRRGAYCTAVATVAARSPPLAGLPPSKDCRCVLEAWAVATVKNRDRDRSVQNHRPNTHDPQSCAVSLSTYHSG